MTRRRHPPPPIEAVASIAQRLAVLLGAGVPPPAAWRLVDADSASGSRSDAERVVARVAGVPDGMPLADAIAGHTAPEPSARPRSGANASRARPRARPDSQADASSAAWRALAAAWLVATEAGAPLAATLRVLAESFHAIGQAERDIQVALAGPRATARIVIALPFVGILFGLGMGFDTLSVLFASVPGLACLTFGSLLLFAGARWNRALVARALPGASAPGLALDLLAIGMSGGASIDRARSLVAEASQRFRLGKPTAGPDAAERVLAMALRAGVPAAELLRTEAEQCRREARSAAQQDAVTLGVTLMLPLGCCVLPSFLLLGVAPVLIALVSSTVGDLA